MPKPKGGDILSDSSYIAAYDIGTTGTNLSPLRPFTMQAKNFSRL